MRKTRRDFLYTGSLVAAGSLLSASNLFAEAGGSGKLDKFGIQLWSVRNDMGKQATDTLTRLASYGYKQIESCDVGKGIFWGMKNTEFKKQLDDLGLSCPSTHTDVYKNYEKTIEEAAAVGIKYVIFAWEGPNKTLDDYKKMADDFNRKGEIAKAAGLVFAFHNHQYTFMPMEGQYAQDILMERTDADKVAFEMDIYWVVSAGQDPIQWLKKYENRFKLSHVKDRLRSAADTDMDASCNLGTGRIDFNKILPIARKCGMEYFHVEQEKWEGSNPMKSAEDNAAFMKQVKV